MTRFLYELDDLSFEFPWTRPDLLRVKLWFKDLLRDYPASRGFDYQVLGDFWSSGRDEAWSIVLFVSSEEYTDPMAAPPPMLAQTAFDLLRFGVTTGINNHRLLIEPGLVPRRSTDQLFRLIRRAESEGKVPADAANLLARRFEAFRRVRKTVNGVVEFDNELACSDSIPVAGGALVDRAGSFARGLLHKAALGRIYYPPVSLHATFGLEASPLPTSEQG